MSGSRLSRFSRVLLLVAALSMLAPAAAAFAAPARPAGTERLIVSYHAGNHTAAAKLEKAAGAKHLGTIHKLGYRIVEVPAGQARRALARFRGAGAVRFAEIDAAVKADLVTPTDPLWTSQWGLGKVAAPSAWATTTGSSDVTVAVLDTGVDPNHPDLRGAVSPGRSFISGVSSSMDDNGHGTAVAGIVAARTNNGIGIAGACWSCRILPVKVLSATGSGTMSAAANGLIWAADQGVQVANLSLSGASHTQTMLDAVRYARDKGVLVIASAGNNGDTTLSYPAAYDEVVSVAGSTSTDGRYSWSTHGSWVDVAAPGCNRTTRLGDTYSDFCGTSSAAPLTAGVAALAFAAAPTATHTQIRNALEATSSSVSYVRAGRIDAEKAVAQAIETTAPAPAPVVEEPVTEEPVQEEPAPQPAPTTSTFSGTLNKKHTVRSSTFTSAAGDATATLTFTKATSLTLRIKDATGKVLAEQTGRSGLKLNFTVPAGTHTVEVAGTQGNFTATVSHLTESNSATRRGKR